MDNIIGYRGLKKGQLFAFTGADMESTGNCQKVGKVDKIMKINKKMMILTSLVCLLPIIAGILLYKKIPDTVVTHWDMEGVPNGYSSRFVGIILYPGILLLVNLLFPILIKTDPKYENIDKKVLAIIYWIIPIVAIFCSASTILYALGIKINIPFTGTVFMGLMIMVIGNYMPKMSQSYTVGIKIPWTLYDNENWDKTHRFTGFFWVFCGLLILVTAFVPGGGGFLIFVFLMMIFVPFIYSYLLYRKKLRKQ